jgi:hypothetical protein
MDEPEQKKELEHVPNAGHVRFDLSVIADEPKEIARLAGWIESHITQALFDDERHCEVRILKYGDEDRQHIWVDLIRHVDSTLHLRGSDRSDPITFLTDVSIEFPTLTFYCENCEDYYQADIRDYVARDGDVACLRQWWFNPNTGLGDHDYVDAALVEEPPGSSSSEPPAPSSDSSD